MKLVLFCEAAADFRTAGGLVDRVLREEGSAWIRDLLDAHPEAVLALVLRNVAEPLAFVSVTTACASTNAVRSAVNATSVIGRSPNMAAFVVKPLSIADPLACTPG